MTDEAVSLKWWMHQKRWLDDRSRMRVCCKARQIGMSTVLAVEALYAAAHGQTTVIVSASQRQASELLRKATHLLPLTLAAGQGFIRIVSRSYDVIELSTGGRVISLPAASATVQGYTGNVVIDEAAWIPNMDDLWMAVVPTISTRAQYRLSVVSTPGPKAGMFHRVWHHDDSTWSRHRVTIHDACAGGAPHNVEALRAAVTDELTWRAAYECEFIDEAHALLPYELLLSRTDGALDYHLDVQALSPTADLYAGYDVGRKHDLSVLIVLERVKTSGANGRNAPGVQLRWRGAVELRRTPFDEQFRLLSSVLRMSGLRRLSIDQSGLGMQLAESLVKDYGRQVEPITMTAPTKEALASRILAAFQRGDVTIPDHRPLLDDLHSIQRSITIAGNVRYAAPREAGSHADRWTALALALEAAASVTVPMPMPSMPDRSASRRAMLRA